MSSQVRVGGEPGGRGDATPPDRRWPRLGCALLVVSALAGGFVAGRASISPAPETEGLAPAGVTTSLAARVAAVNAGDVEAIESFYATDAVLEEMDQDPPIVTRTGPAIASHLRGYQQLGFRLEQTGTATQLGPFVSEPLLWSGGGGGMVVYRLDDEGKIVHQWVTGGSVRTGDAP